MILRRPNSALTDTNTITNTNTIRHADTNKGDTINISITNGMTVVHRDTCDERPNPELFTLFIDKECTKVLERILHLTIFCSTFHSYFQPFNLFNQLSDLLGKAY